MLEIVVLAILILAAVGGAVLDAREKETALWTWPVMPVDMSKGEPAEEGAMVPDGTAQVTGGEMREAA